MKENKINVKIILEDGEKVCKANIGDNLLDVIRKNNIDVLGNFYETHEMTRVSKDGVAKSLAKIEILLK